MTPTSHEGVWNLLHLSQIVTGEPPTVDSPSPWYVRALLGIAGWIAAFFALGFIGVGFSFIVRSASASVITGIVVIGGAYALFRAAGKNDFAAQFGVAASFAGQALIVFGIMSGSGRLAGQWFMIAALEAALVWLLPNFVHRVWAAYAAGTATAMALAASGAYFLSVGLLAAAVADIWLNEFAWARRSSLVRPLGYGLTLALIQVQATVFRRPMLEDLFYSSSPPPDWVPSWVGATLPAAVLFVVVWRLLARARHPMSRASALMSLLAAIAVGVVSFRAPGIATGLMIVVLGHANGNHSLSSLGIVALLLYISAYYYLIELTLLAKSFALAIAGTVLLVLRWVLSTWFFPEPEEEAGDA
jgi:uncharacterized membrane protein